MKKSLIARIVSLSCAAAITFMMVSLLADYGLPQVGRGGELASQAASRAG